MPPGKSLRRAGPCTLALALACALSPASAWGAASRPDDGALSPRLAELARPSVRTAPPAKQARDLSVAIEGPGSLLHEGNRVLVEVRFDHGAAAGVDDLRATGAKIVDVSSRYQTVTVAAKPGELTQLRDISRVAAATEVLTPITAVSSTCPSGVAVSEGDAQLHAAEARTAFGIDGTGVTVGILSDSFNRDGFADTHEGEDVESGDLPGTGNTCPGQATPVNTALDDYEPGPEESAPEDEGRAMAQIVHDLAPGAELSFATAFTGLTAFAGNVEALAAAGAKVIADDVSYFEEPFFQEGPVGVAVSKVTASGVSYFSSAGNNNLIAGGNDIASWEAPEFRDAGGCPTGVPVYAEHCMDFDPKAPIDSTFGVKVSPGVTLRVDLQWNQPWSGVTTDLDAYLLNSTNKLLAASEEANAMSTQIPFEFLPWTNTTGTAQTVRIAINRCDSICGGASGGDTGSPRLKFALLENGEGVTEAEYPESSEGPEGDVVGPTIFGHNGAEDAVSVGAIRFNATEAPETFSSRGPVTHYFKPVEGVTPAEPLGSPQILSKPDVVATDGGANTFFGSCVSNTWRFFGTSAAAPHAAAVAALERQAVPGATPEEVKQAQLETAGPVGAFSRPGPEVGAGIVNAGAAIAKLKSEPFSESSIEAGAPPLNCELPEPEVPPSEEAKKEIETTKPPVEEPPPVVPPRTFILKHPPKVIRARQLKAKVVFRFGASESGVTFVCRVDGTPFRGCPRRLMRRFGVGPHVLRVMARDEAGNTDPTPAVFRFRVKLIG
jgi:subtilisin family serine protease